MEELILQLPVIREIAAWAHSGTELQQTWKTSFTHGLWAALAMTVAWRLRRRLSLPVLTTTLILVIAYYGQREVGDYARGGVQKAFDCVMDFVVPALLSSSMYWSLLKYRDRLIDVAT
ncbi:MAG: hypothetical protein MJB57_11740 [Gemmatimonadetes bacterium]|nr:hypothetical protein [Gemmatimonadota bacterium]